MPKHHMTTNGPIGKPKHPQTYRDGSKKESQREYKPRTDDNYKRNQPIKGKQNRKQTNVVHRKYPKVSLRVGGSSDQPSEGDKFLLARINPGTLSNYVHDNVVLPWNCPVIHGQIQYPVATPANGTTCTVLTFFPVIGAAYGNAGLNWTQNLTPASTVDENQYTINGQSQTQIYGTAAAVVDFYSQRFVWSSAMEVTVEAAQATMCGTLTVTTLPAASINGMTYAQLIRLGTSYSLRDTTKHSIKSSIMNTHLIYHAATGNLINNPDLQAESVTFMIYQNVAQSITVAGQVPFTLRVNIVSNAAMIPYSNPAAMSLMMRTAPANGMRKLTLGEDVDTLALTNGSTKDSWTDKIGGFFSKVGNVIGNNYSSWKSNFKDLMKGLPMLAQFSGRMIPNQSRPMILNDSRLNWGIDNEEVDFYLTSIRKNIQFLQKIGDSSILIKCQAMLFILDGDAEVSEESSSY